MPPLHGRIYPSIVEAVGHTPLVDLRRVGRGLPGRVALKCEFLNPLASVKDRIGRAMIEAAEADGRLRGGMTVVEPTSGNTGISLAFACAAKGYKLVLAMPESMSVERRLLLRQLGAEVVLTPAADGMSGAVARARGLADEMGHERVFEPRQFDNPANPEAHRRTTAKEIWQDTSAGVDCFVAGVGTGGTITGVGSVLKKLRADIRVIAVEPAESPVLSGGRPGRHRIQGIGAGFVPGVLDVSLLDEVIQVTSDEAFAMARRLAAEEGLPAGISTGANVTAALRVARRDDMAGKLIVTIGCSSVERYLSTPLVDDARRAEGPAS